MRELHALYKRRYYGVKRLNMLVCGFIVCTPQNNVFSRGGPINYDEKFQTYQKLLFLCNTKTVIRLQKAGTHYMDRFTFLYNCVVNQIQFKQEISVTYKY